jgi:YnbE-like lipoprotein
MKDGRSKFGTLLGATVALGTLGGCVEVTAPDKPIEINLNINIRQEVVVRLAQDVRDLKRREPGVF